MDDLDGAREDSAINAPHSVLRALQSVVKLVIEVAETLAETYSKSRKSKTGTHVYVT